MRRKHRPHRERTEKTVLPIRLGAIGRASGDVTLTGRPHLMLIAYIDLALGSMLIQAMAGIVLAGMVMGRRFLAAPFAWFSSKNAQEPESELQEVGDLASK